MTAPIPDAAAPGVHPTAIVAASARLAPDASVGPYAIIGEDVTIGAGTSIAAHAVIAARTTLGQRNRVFQFASIGEIAQDRKYAGEPARTVIGDDNVFREFTTVNGGTALDRNETRIGNGNWFLAYTHVAHDCVIGNHTTWSNNAQVAGHVQVDDHAVLGAFAGVHQFCRVGAHAMLGAFAVVLQDVPPFILVQGYPAQPRGPNVEGLKRRGFTREDIAAVRRAYRLLFRDGLSLEDAREAIGRAAAESPVLDALVSFLAVPGRGILR